MRIWILLIACVAVLLTSDSIAQQTPGRFAILIGNQNYDATVGPLKHPHNDVKLIGDALTKVGFKITRTVLDGRRDTMLAAVHELGSALNKAGKGAIGFVYYSGHGVSMASENILVPVNVNDVTDQSLSIHGVTLKDVIDTLERRAPASVNFLVIDACRNNLSGTKGAKGFIPVQDHRTGMVIAFATAAGATAIDDGYYAASLAETIVTPGMNDQQVFNVVRSRVVSRSPAQIPWIHDGLIGDRVIFRAAEERASGLTQTSSIDAVEVERFHAIRGSDDPEVLATYLKVYPNGIFAEVVVTLIQKIEQQRRQIQIELDSRLAAEAAAEEKLRAEELRRDAGERARTAERSKQKVDTRVAQQAQKAAEAAVAEAERKRAEAERAAADAQTQANQLQTERIAQATAATSPSTDSPPLLRANLATASIMRAISVSPDGREMAVAGDDGIVRILAVGSFKLLRQFSKTRAATVRSLAFSGDGSILMAGRDDGVVIFYDASTGHATATLKSSNSKIMTVAYYPTETRKYALTGGNDGLEIWNLRRDAVAGRPGLHRGAIRSVAYSGQKNGIFVSGGEDGQLIFYLPNNRQKPLRAHRGSVFSTTYSIDNKYVASGGADGLVKIWDAATQSEKAAMQGHLRYVLSVAFSANGNFVASGGADRLVRVWSVEDTKLVAKLEGHSGDIESVKFIDRDRYVVSVSEDKSLRVWNATSGASLLTAAFYGDGDYVAISQHGHYTGSEGANRRLEIVTAGRVRSLTEVDHQERFRPSGIDFGFPIR